MKIGVITACWVYKLSGYDASTPWGEAQGRFEQQWSPEALDGLLGEIKELGFDWVELWRGTTGFERWSDDQLGAVRDSLARREVQLASYCVGGIEPSTDIESAFAYGKKLGAPMCTGYLTNENVEERAELLAKVAEKHGMQYGIENHGRDHTVADPDDILKLAARYPGVIGACPDTGIYYRGGDDPLAVAQALKEVTIHTHLKDVDETGSCGVGEGELPMADIIRTFREAGYDGVYSVEREGNGDPTALLRRSAAFIREVLAP